MKRSFKRIIPLLLIIALLAGCRSTKPSSSYKRASGTYVSEPAMAASAPAEYGMNGAMYDMYYEAAEEEMDVPTSAEAKSTSGSTNNAFPTGRKIIRNADMSIQTREYDAFMTELQTRIAANGGYVESSSSSGNGYSSKKTVRSSQLTVRIPADKLDEFLDGVGTMGNVLYKNLYSSDVTASYVDTEARLKALRTERDTLMGLLEKADKMEDIIVIYQRISDVTYEIESYESRLRTYDDKISYSTVNISISEVERETVVNKETTWQEITRRLGENLQDIGEGFKEFFIDFVSALPRLVLVALFLFVIYLIVRAIIRKSRKKSAEKRAAAAAQKPVQAKKPEEKKPAAEPEKTPENKK